MYSNEDLDSAVAAGVISAENAQNFRKHIASTRITPVVDEEYFRLVTGFNDIFVVIACLLLLVSIVFIGNASSAFLGAGLQAITAWGLAEYFTRQRRMALPSIVLLLAFVSGIFTLGIVIQTEIKLLSDDMGFVIPAAMTAIAARLHWLRFKVPITVAAGTVAVVIMIMAFIISQLPSEHYLLMPIIFIAGLIVFLLAMRWDSSDVQRQTRRSDVAFWLHLIAAPLMVHPVFSVLRIFDAEVGLVQISAVIMLYILIAIISISIDRRAMMVSALVYVLYAFNTLLEQYGIVSLGFAFTAFSIGSGLLLLSAFWQWFRKILLAIYPESIRNKLPALR